MHSFSRPSATWSILIHGGAGDLDPDRIPQHVAAARKAIAKSLEILAQNGSALDAVEAAVSALESDPHFNAGTGACLDEEGHIELDASIMSGADLRAGAVCALPPFEHPIAIARAALEDGRHVLYASEGAARFALAHGFTRADESAMITERARERLRIAKTRNESQNWAGGTVGAVARDIHGHVAAATSTGGRVNKRKGRVGDSPIVGAGTYADDESGAASTTGDGEAMMRLCTARSAIDAMRSETPENAARRAITNLDRLHAKGGIIVVSNDGSIGWARNTLSMTWATAREGAEIEAGA